MYLQNSTKNSIFFFFKLGSKNQIHNYATMFEIFIFYPKNKLWFHEKIVKFYQNWIFGQKFDFSNGVIGTLSDWFLCLDPGFLLRINRIRFWILKVVGLINSIILNFDEFFIFEYFDFYICLPTNSVLNNWSVWSNILRPKNIKNFNLQFGIISWFQ